MARSKLSAAPMPRPTDLLTPHLFERIALFFRKHPKTNWIPGGKKPEADRPGVYMRKEVTEAGVTVLRLDRWTGGTTGTWLDGVRPRPDGWDAVSSCQSLAWCGLTGPVPEDLLE